MIIIFIQICLRFVKTASKLIYGCYLRELLLEFILIERAFIAATQLYFYIVSLAQIATIFILISISLACFWAFWEELLAIPIISTSIVCRCIIFFNIDGEVNVGVDFGALVFPLVKTEVASSVRIAFILSR